MSNATTQLCTALRTWRIRARLRQDAVAQCLGVAQSQISRWESGRDLPRAENLDAIQRLIRGAETDSIAALRHFVANSHQQLLLLDAGAHILAQSVPMQSPNCDLRKFGWVLDPAAHPAFGPVLRRFEKLMENPGTAVGLEIALPFSHESEAWIATLHLTPQYAGAVAVCLAELRFSTADMVIAETRLEEIRLGGDGSMRTSTTIWPAPLA